MKAHATDALTMAFTALASGALIGIMGKSPMLDAMTEMVLSFMPESMAPHLHVLFSVVTSPLSMIIHGDALTYGIIPIINQIVSAYGIPAAATAAVELKDHIAFSFKWAFLMSLVMLVFVVVTGIIPL